MNLTVIISLIAAISAILAPFLTAIINNRHQTKMEDRKLYIERKINAIDKYLDLAGKALVNPNNASINEFGENHGSIFLYAPKSAWDEIEHLNSNILSRDIVDGRNTLLALSKLFSDDLAINVGHKQ